jgi:hypothetical protein
MAERRSERAKRRIAERTAKNALALETAVVTEEERPRAKVARHMSQLAFLAARSVISIQQRAAGEIFVAHFRAAGGMPKLIASYGPPTGRPTKAQFMFDSNADHPRRVDARRRFERAARILGPLAAITMHVAICDEPPSAWPHPGMRNGSDRIGVLRLALDTLAAFYGLDDYSGARAA